uniref:Uncharacterized protein n=1 Tax=Chlamydomonas leiostraca TaxID=1034604 RepID=A0A7S0WG26_9CHLO
MAARNLAKLAPGLLQAARASSALAGAISEATQAAPAAKVFCSWLGANARTFHSSSLLSQASKAVTSPEPARKYRALVDKELWHEAWMYEDRFGSEEDPIVVPSLEAERIIGVTDPEDDNLVVWGILRANEPPRQFIEGGEFYVLKEVPAILKVGDVIAEIEAGKSAANLAK